MYVGEIEAILFQVYNVRMQGKSKLRKPDYKKKLQEEMGKSIGKYEIFVSSLTNATQTEMEETPESAASTFTENEASTMVEAVSMEVDENTVNTTDNCTVGEVNMTEVEATGRGHRQRKERQMTSL